MSGAAFHVRRASVDDAGAIAKVLSQVVAERVHSAIDKAWAADEQRRYLQQLSPREACHVAIAGSDEVVGYQSLDLYSPVLGALAHVGQIGTFLLPAWRRQGVGHALFRETSLFAASVGYRKLVIQVRASNER